MGKIKDNGTKKYTLTDGEFEYVKALNTLLSYNVGQQQMVSGYLHTLASLKHGYPSDKNLQFEIDFDSDSHELSITPQS